MRAIAHALQLIGRVDPGGHYDLAMSTQHFDLVIIGSGSGNSIIGPEFDDLKIAMIEKGVFGGTCLNVGCIPTKMFVYPADVATDAGALDRLGVRFDRPQVRWSEIRDRVFGRIDQIPPAGEDYRRGLPNVTVYKGKATFVGPKTLDTGTGETITADRIVIAAGGYPQMLDVPGLDQADPARGIHTNDSIMRLDELPDRIIIIGGGFIAAEFAHVFGGFGSQVTWIQRSDTLLRSQDETISARYTEIATKQYDVRLGAQPIKAEHVGSDIQVTCASADGEFVISAPVVLVATGRLPYATDLNVQVAGIAQHNDGRIKVDSYQQTSVEGIFALGDISSDYQLKHVANREAKTVKYNLAHPEAMIPTDHRVVPHAVFSHPQIASFGATEQQLKAAGTRYLVKIQDFGDVAYGWAMEDKTGIVKLLADPTTRQLLGAHIMGHEASILIQPLIQGAQFNQTVDQIATDQYWIHPALSEVIENALLGLEPSSD